MKPKDIKIVNSDFRTLDLTPNSVDMIFTDPPYGELPEWTDDWIEFGDLLMTYLDNLMEDLEDGTALVEETPFVLHELPEGFIPFPKRVLGHNFNPDLPQVWQKFGPFRPASKVKDAGAMSAFDERTPHGMGHERGEIICARRLLDGQVGQYKVVGVADDHTDPQVAAFWNRQEVGFPSVFFLGKVTQFAFDEGHALAELQLVAFINQGRPSAVGLLPVPQFDSSSW